MSLRKLAAAVVGAVLVATASAAATTTGASAVPPPGQILISDTQGVIWSYDLAANELSRLVDVTPSNFDIQYADPGSVLIGNNEGFVSELDLSTLEETVVITDLAGSRGLAVSPRKGGTYYIAEASAGVISTVSRGSTTPEILINGLESLENVAVDKQGVVYFTAGRQLGRVDPGAEPATVEVVATFPEDVATLNGLVVTPMGTAYVSAQSEYGIYEVDLSTGEFADAYAGQPLPGAGEDVALGPNGDIYVAYSGIDGGLYRIPVGSDAIEPLYVGAPLVDPVDILLTPFRGF